MYESGEYEVKKSMLRFRDRIIFQVDMLPIFIKVNIYIRKCAKIYWVIAYVFPGVVVICHTYGWVVQLGLFWLDKRSEQKIVKLYKTDIFV